jgi:hypothetical protein
VITPFGPQHHLVGPGDPAIFMFRFDAPARYGLRAIRVRSSQARIQIGSRARLCGSGHGGLRHNAAT